MDDIERVTRERDEALKQLRLTTGLDWAATIAERVRLEVTATRCQTCGGACVLSEPDVVMGGTIDRTCVDCGGDGWVLVPVRWSTSDHSR